MSSSQFISVRETAQMMGISEKKVMDLIEQRKLQAYRIADKFLRLKRDEVLALTNTGSVIRENVELPYTSAEKTADFFYFNDFYMVSVVIICLLLYVVLFTSG